MPAPEHPAPVLGAGLAILLGGVALLLQELDLLTLRWSLVLPVILVVVGLVVALAGVAGTARGR
ncbi:hypothetical protein [Pseudonocardia sp. GCM10023141]|uniref:hypothetical protein n=1 Tax=Pseudonocardia sp. GCM10023141 TaxID=3252653 RepID=UPI003609B366